MESEIKESEKHIAFSYDNEYDKQVFESSLKRFMNSFWSQEYCVEGLEPLNIADGLGKIADNLGKIAEALNKNKEK